MVSTGVRSRRDRTNVAAFPRAAPLFGDFIVASGVEFGVVHLFILASAGSRGVTAEKKGTQRYGQSGRYGPASSDPTPSHADLQSERTSRA